MSNNLQLPKDRNIYFTKQVDQSSIGDLTKHIIEINEDDKHLKKVYSVYGIEYKPKPIKIYIDSYGGAVYQCFGLLSVMERSKTPIHTIVTGCAMSCGIGEKVTSNKINFALDDFEVLENEFKDVIRDNKLKKILRDV